MNQENKSDIFNEKPSVRYKTAAINETRTVTDTFGGNTMRDDEHVSRDNPHRQ